MLLQDLAQVIRSKNAGPRMLTLDIIFAEESSYQRVADGGAINASRIAGLYGVEAQTVTVMNYPVGCAIKVSIPRVITAGDPGDRDVYGAQQHAPLLELEV